MPNVAGPRILVNNGEDAREQKHPDDLYAEAEHAIMSDASDGTGITITVAAAGTYQRLLHASGFQSDTIGDITVAPTTGIFTCKKAGKYRVNFEGQVKGTNAKYYLLAALKNGSAVANSVRRVAAQATAVFQNVTAGWYLDLNPGDTCSLGIDVETSANTVTFDGFTLEVRLIESQG